MHAIDVYQIVASVLPHELDRGVNADSIEPYCWDGMQDR